MFVADVDGWFRTGNQSVVGSAFDVSLQGTLAKFPRHLGAWQGEDVTSNGADLLGFDPQQQVFRAYQDGLGGFLWLRLVASNDWKLFYHTPPICYSNNNWRLGPETVYQIGLGKTTLPAKSFVAQQNQNQHLVLYSFLWPSKYRDMRSGATMFELATPFHGDKNAALNELEAFTRLIFSDGPSAPKGGSSPMQQRVGANLDNKITLLGYDLSSKELRPGQTLTVTLYWQARAAIHQNYTVFVHVLKRPEDASPDRVLVQEDQQPFDGLYPTSRWQVGQVVKETYELTIPAGVTAGERQVEVGMYLLATQRRLSVLDSAGHPTGDSIMLSPIRIDTPSTP